MAQLINRRTNRVWTGRRSRTTHVATAGMLCALGDTPAAAAATLNDLIVAALTDSYEPAVVRIFDEIAVIWRDPCSWYYQRGSTGHSSALDSRDAALSAARRHLAQFTWQPDRTEAILGLLTPSERPDFLSWVQFQERYADAIAAGRTDVEAHRIAASSRASAIV